MPTQLGLGTCKALAARVDPDGCSACVRLIHDEIGKIEFKGRDFPIDRSGETLDAQATLVTVGVLRVQDGGAHVRTEIDGGRLERVAILSEENPALRHPGRTGLRTCAWAANATRLRWLTTTPFGRPVEPEVYMT